LYNPNLFAQVQKSIFPIAASDPTSFHSVPYVYLPVFVLPFQLFALINLQTGYWIWTLVNLVGFSLYLRFFSRKMNGQPLPLRLLFLLLLSLPIFQNLFLGQINIFLGICAGEFLRSYHSNRPFRAGLWLGGWLIKPQLLILIAPFLLASRSWKALAGLLSATLALLAISYGMAGMTGLQGWWEILTGSAHGGAASNAEIMMNWRMLDLNLTNFVTPLYGRIVLIVGSAITAVAALYLAMRFKPGDTTRSMIIFLGLFAATCMLAWHAHFSMSIILIPPLLLLTLQKRLPNKLLLLWVFLPTGVLLITYLLAALAQAGYLPAGIAVWLDLATGLRGLVLNLILMTWAVMQIRVMKTDGSFQLLNNRNDTSG
ncbi:MAG: glycosyltransferase family 87 protein, partial [Anaerolineaceae bacterium]